MGRSRATTYSMGTSSPSGAALLRARSSAASDGSTPTMRAPRDARRADGPGSRCGSPDARSCAFAREQELERQLAEKREVARDDEGLHHRRVRRRRASPWGTPLKRAINPAASKAMPFPRRPRGRFSRAGGPNAQIPRGNLARCSPSLVGRAADGPRRRCPRGLSAPAVAADRASRLRRRWHRVRTAAAGPALASPCPPGTLPDNGVCVPVPSEAAGGEALAADKNAHRERAGHGASTIRSRAVRSGPATTAAIACRCRRLPGQNLVVSGYDLDRPDREQRRGAQLKAIGHGGIDIAAEARHRGAPGRPRAPGGRRGGAVRGRGVRQLRGDSPHRTRRRAAARVRRRVRASRRARAGPTPG